MIEGMNMRYIFLALLGLNVLAFGYYSYLHKPVTSNSVIQAQAKLINPVDVKNVSSELPPLIGKKS